MTSSTPDITSPVTPTPMTEGQRLATEGQAYEASRAEDPVVVGAMSYLTDLSKVAKGEEFVRLAGGALKFAEDYARAKNSKNH